jgi:hypothetical protein
MTGICIEEDMSGITTHMQQAHTIQQVLQLMMHLQHLEILLQWS